MSKVDAAEIHSPAWVAQTWVSFVVSLGVTAIGIQAGAGARRPLPPKG